VARLRTLVLISTLVLASGATSLDAQQPDLQGVYELDGAASDDDGAAITAGTADMSFVIRALARRRIAQTNPRYERIRLARDDTTVKVQFDARAPIELPLDGHPVRRVRGDGGEDDVSASWSATELVLRFRSDNGARTNTLALDPDGRTLKLKVELFSSYFDAPIRYVLTYRRQAADAKHG
jgi:hypothetical protein